MRGTSGRREDVGQRGIAHSCGSAVATGGILISREADGGRGSACGKRAGGGAARAGGRGGVEVECRPLHARGLGGSVPRCIKCRDRVGVSGGSGKASVAVGSGGGGGNLIPVAEYLVAGDCHIIGRRNPGEIDL